jgi:HSP20 family molecular chaperone IbpA
MQYLDYGYGPGWFDTTISERFVEDDNGTITTSYYMHLRHQNTTMRYFPGDGDTTIPQVSFNPKYDVFDRDDKWVIMMDILDSEYSISYHKDRITIYGCRYLSNEYQYGNYQKMNRIDSRKYSTFSIEIKAPEKLNCESDKHIIIDPKDNKGVLLIIYDKNSSPMSGYSTSRLEAMEAL